jgi:hypothetical protein
MLTHHDDSFSFFPPLFVFFFSELSVFGCGSTHASSSAAFPRHREVKRGLMSEKAYERKHLKKSN